MVDRFKKLGTSTISDALDKLDIPGQCFGMRSHSLQWNIAGRAFTVRYGPVDVQKGTVGDFIDDVKPGDIIVIDNQGRLDCTVWGDIMTGVAKRKGIAGTVIDGACRDTNRILELDYPVFSAGRYMRTGKDRVQVDAVGEAISIADVRVRHGDIVAADADGVVVIPKEYEKEVLAVADKIEAAEKQIREAAEKGMSLKEARDRFHYHHLQTKGE
ncbi:RraA family protein [Bacillus subtilis]|uniref:RraA family protein n=1 Tax=Bacillus TaxID=1386 RepID=UPI000C25ED2A|nr:RraA family protein [Bacillus subtilis]MCM3013809.1 RraA family protein [Bacillus subtilis]MCM3523526.1 RraA family protein [Bacillus subtilis]MED3515696.1 RraA family protein [Bacillus subtilis]MED3519614.1 RraA family protein [Bacillus subtilis]PJM66404.1 diguanylate cyclase [Bacillus subtilis]